MYKPGTLVMYAIGSKNHENRVEYIFDRAFTGRVKEAWSKPDIMDRNYRHNYYDLVSEEGNFIKNPLGALFDSKTFLEDHLSSVEEYDAKMTLRKKEGEELAKTEEENRKAQVLPEIRDALLRIADSLERLSGKKDALNNPDAPDPAVENTDGVDKDGISKSDYAYLVSDNFIHSVRELIDYDRASEQEDFEQIHENDEEAREGHIFNHIKRIDDELKSMGL